MSTKPTPLTRDERESAARLAGLPHGTLCAGTIARYEATLTEVEAESAAHKRDFEAELAGNKALREKYGARPDETMESWIARLKAVACEWEPWGYREHGFEVGSGGLLLISDELHVDRKEAGCLAATLAHFARTGELPK